MRWLRYLALVLALGSAWPALAVQPDEILPDPALEARARDLSRELRCMICQNQSIDDSDAPIARDLRILVRERLKAGDSNGQVLDYLTSRYGEFVLLRPRFGWHTALLWLWPAILLILGALGLVYIARRSAKPVAAGGPGEQAPLSTREQSKLAELLRRGQK
jgi:cytochrome c-type biogenesis protein CcmH